MNKTQQIEVMVIPANGEAYPVPFSTLKEYQAAVGGRLSPLVRRSRCSGTRGSIPWASTTTTGAQLVRGGSWHGSRDCGTVHYSSHRGGDSWQAGTQQQGGKMHSNTETQTVTVEESILAVTFLLRVDGDEFTVEVREGMPHRNGERTYHTIYNEEGDRLSVDEADDLAERLGWGDSAEMATDLVFDWWRGKFGPHGACDGYPL